MTAFRSTVSTALQHAGFNPLAPQSYHSKGLRVMRTRHAGVVRVVADLDDDSAAAKTITDVIETLTGLGYLVLQSAPNAAHVSH